MFDLTPETLQIARTRVAADKVTFVIDDAYELGNVGGTFGAAFAGFWFSHVPRSRQREFLQRLGSRLAPGATVILLDNQIELAH